MTILTWCNNPPIDDNSDLRQQSTYRWQFCPAAVVVQHSEKQQSRSYQWCICAHRWAERWRHHTPSWHCRWRRCWGFSWRPPVQPHGKQPACQLFRSLAWSTLHWGWGPEWNALRPAQKKHTTPLGKQGRGGDTKVLLMRLWTHVPHVCMHAITSYRTLKIL